MLKSRKKTGKELLYAGLVVIVSQLLSIAVKSAIWLVGTNLILRPWTNQRIDFWAALGVVMLGSVLRDTFAPKKDE